MRETGTGVGAGPLSRPSRSTVRASIFPGSGMSSDQLPDGIGAAVDSIRWRGALRPCTRASQTCASPCWMRSTGSISSGSASASASAGRWWSSHRFASRETRAWSRPTWICRADDSRRWVSPSTSRCRPMRAGASSGSRPWSVCHSISSRPDRIAFRPSSCVIRSAKDSLFGPWSVLATVRIDLRHATRLTQRPPSLASTGSLIRTYRGWPRLPQNA